MRSLSYQDLEPYLAFRPETREDTAKALRAARLGLVPEDYLLRSLVVPAVAAACASVAATALFLVVSPWPFYLDIVFGIGVAFVTFACTRLAFLLWPRTVAASRRSKIDAEFPSVVLLCYALAEGGLPPLRVFKAISEERSLYGEASREFGVVVRNVEWLGMDLNAALKEVAETTPSHLVRQYFEGLHTIMNSGADPVDFFQRQAETQLMNAELGLEKELDHAGLLAEVYVSGLLVLPLLLIVLLSLLSALGNGGESVVPLVVYLLIPGGTLFYLLFLEMALPPDRLVLPPRPKDALVDFGIGTLPKDEPGLPEMHITVADVEREHADIGDQPLRRRVLAEWTRRRALETWHDFFRRAVVKPLDAIEVSGAAGLLVFAAGGAAALYVGDRGSELAITTTGLVLLAAAIAIIPVSVFHEMRVWRARTVEKALPETLGRLSGFNERGIGLLQSFELLGRTSSGPLASELRALERDVSWSSDLRHALGRLRQRINTLTMAKLTVLFERASAATGDLRKVLKIVAYDSARQESLRSRRRQSMATYVIVIYVVFAVFLYVTYIVTDLFYGDAGFAAVSGGTKGLKPETARVLFFQAVVLQGTCCGLVAGKLGEGHLLSGLKHAVILATVGWLVFQAGVLA